MRHQIVKVGDLDTEAAFMQSLVPHKEERVEKESSAESSQHKKDPEEDALTKPENEKLVEKEQIETESQTELENEEYKKFHIDPLTVRTALAISIASPKEQLKSLQQTLLHLDKHMMMSL